MYPLKFRPIFKERIWGGQTLRSTFNKDIPADVKIGESWELADVGEDKSIIVNGELAGETIASAIEKCGTAITGNESFQPPFPLLIKILDAQDVLSVQVHPDAETCKRTGKGEPKTECWYIIKAAPDAVIYKGLSDGVTKEQFAKAIEDGTCADLLKKVPVEAGQCHFLPSGTAHAIGKGLLIAEIQQPSDTTYRVFDWNRVDADGKGRQLHVEEAIESIHFDQPENELTVGVMGRLVDSDQFKVGKGDMRPGEEMLLSPGKMKVLVIINGKGNIVGEDVEDVGFVKGDTLLVPAGFEGVMSFESSCEYLTVTV
ncbi:MAG: class I mannose-6-phosphate isomerase [Anaerohalosphaera sp.]|nr:class I mannose-6-phosphate isomerase [Anaerohalosphaera sp.]